MLKENSVDFFPGIEVIFSPQEFTISATDDPNCPMPIAINVDYSTTKKRFDY